MPPSYPTPSKPLPKRSSPLPGPAKGIPPFPGKTPTPGSASTVNITARQGGQEATVHETNRQGSFPTLSTPGPHGVVGVSQGLTIPGPKGSYMAARIEVSVYLPCDPTEASVKETLAACKEQVDRELDALGEEVREFFSK